MAKRKKYNVMDEINYILKSVKDNDKDGMINMFDCEPLNPKKMGMEHQYSFSSTGEKRIRTVKMKPKKFLQETYKESHDDEHGFKNSKQYEDYIKHLKHEPSHVGEKHKTAVEAIKEKIKSKNKSVPIGFLTYSKGLPSGHEGRHTAIAAQELGIKNIPVTVTSYHHEEEPETSKLPLHRKQYALHQWKDYDETEEESKSRAANRIANIIEINKGNNEWQNDDRKEQQEEITKAVKHLDDNKPIEQTENETEDEKEE